MKAKKLNCKLSDNNQFQNNGRQASTKMQKEIIQDRTIKFSN